MVPETRLCGLVIPRHGASLEFTIRRLRDLIILVCFGVCFLPCDYCLYIIDPITGFISLIVTFLLIFALLLLMCYYCYTRFMSEKKNFHRLQHNDESYSDNNTFSGKASDKYDEHYSSIGKIVIASIASKIWNFMNLN